MSHAVQVSQAAQVDVREQAEDGEALGGRGQGQAEGQAEEMIWCLRCGTTHAQLLIGAWRRGGIVIGAHG